MKKKFYLLLITALFGVIAGTYYGISEYVDIYGIGQTHSIVQVASGFAPDLKVILEGVYYNVVFALFTIIAWMIFTIKRDKWSIWRDLLFRIWCFLIGGVAGAFTLFWHFSNPLLGLGVLLDGRYWINGITATKGSVPGFAGFIILGLSFGLVVPLVKDPPWWLRYILAILGSIGGYVVFWNQWLLGDLWRGSFTHSAFLGLCCAISWHIAEAKGWKEKL